MPYAYIDTINFDNNFPLSAVVEFTVENGQGADTEKGKITMSIAMSRYNDDFSAGVTLVDQTDIVTEAKRRLHGFATALAEATKDWAAP